MSEDAASATAGPAERVQSAGSEYGFPHGHIGHLNDQEQEVFQRFKLFLQEKGLYQPGPPPSHDDPTLLFVPPSSLRPPRADRRMRATGASFELDVGSLKTPTSSFTKPSSGGSPTTSMSSIIPSTSRRTSRAEEWYAGQGVGADGTGI